MYRKLAIVTGPLVGLVQPPKCKTKSLNVRSSLKVLGSRKTEHVRSSTNMDDFRLNRTRGKFRLAGRFFGLTNQ
jgi:hypothetical protein